MSALAACLRDSGVDGPLERPQRQLAGVDCGRVEALEAELVAKRSRGGAALLQDPELTRRQGRHAPGRQRRLTDDFADVTTLGKRVWLISIVIACSRVHRSACRAASAPSCTAASRPAAGPGHPGSESRIIHAAMLRRWSGCTSGSRMPGTLPPAMILRQMRGRRAGRYRTSAPGDRRGFWSAALALDDVPRQRWHAGRRLACACRLLIRP